MQGVKTCQRCGVPEYIASEHLWHPSGFIVQRRDPRHIIIFIESENLEALFRGIEKILGMSIERIVVNTRRRAARAYMDRVIPEALKEQVRGSALEIGPVVQGMVGIGQVLGYGRFEVADYRMRGDDGDYILIRVEKPYSILLGCADPVAALEALVGREMGLSYREVSPEVYEIKAFPQSHPEEFKGRLTMRKYAYPEGDIRFRPCPQCGAPEELAGFAWDLDRGLIHNRRTGKRMVFFAPSVMEAVFGELERELGETIPEVVIEAQRRLTAAGLYGLDRENAQQDLREQLAIRGLGNLKELSLGERGLSLFMENAAVPLMVVGMAQGLYESLHGGTSRVEWSTGEGDSLSVEVKPA